MKNIVITGSTRGIGFGLADEFLKAGCNVVVSGRTQASVDKAVDSLAEKHDPERILGHPCDVGQLPQVEALWEAAASRFGQIDIWINNAGLSHPSVPGWEVPPKVAEHVVSANILGTIYGTRVAVAGMLAQGMGFIYNLEGFGSNGETRQGLAIYGTTKAAITYFTKAIRKDAADIPVKFGTLRPGMVITDMVMEPMRKNPAQLDSVRPIFNIICSRVEEVVPFLARSILANEKNGAIINFMPSWKLAWRFISSLFVKRDVFS